MTVDRLSLANFIVLGALSVHGDIRHRRIDNRWILASLAISFLAYAHLGLGTLLGSHRLVFLGLGRLYLPGAFFAKAALHASLGCAAAVTLWYMRIWPAGDAKLFIAFAWLLPLADQNLRGFPTYLFLAMLVNIFVSAGVFVAILLPGEWGAALLRLARSEAREAAGNSMDRWRRRIADEWPKRRRYAMLAWNTFALFFVFRMIRGFLEFPNAGVIGGLGIYLVLYYAWSEATAFFIRRDVTAASFFVVSGLAAPFGVYWDRELVSRFIAGGKMALGFWVFMMFARTFLEYYLRTTRLTTVTLGSLAPGAILSEESWEALAKARGEGAQALPTRYSDGLSRDDIAVLHGGRGAALDATVDVYRPRPFAFWVFLGCAWTLMFRENLAEWLISIPSR